MIELDRYIRVKPQGLAWCELADEMKPGIYVYFKRYDVENGKEVAPERSFLTFDEIEAKLAENERQAPILRELLGLRPA